MGLGRMTFRVTLGDTWGGTWGGFRGHLGGTWGGFRGSFIIPQQQNFTMGSLAQITSGAIRCSFNTRFRTRFRRVLVQIPREVPEGSGADTS